MSGNAFDIPPVPVTYNSGSLARGKPTTASNTFFNEQEYSAERATDDDDSTRWATDSGQKPVWLEVDLGEPMRIGRVFIDEPAEYRRIQSFELQYFDGNGLEELSCRHNDRSGMVCRCKARHSESRATQYSQVD